MIYRIFSVNSNFGIIFEVVKLESLRYPHADITRKYAALL